MFRFFPAFRDFVWSATVPEIYWNVYSSEQRIKALCCDLEKLIEYSDGQTAQININAADLKELKTAFEKFQESGFDDYYKRQIEEWIANNLEFIYQNTIKQVYFGLTEEGYFVAYIPESWNEIAFDTGANYSLDSYGRLILKWDTDAASVVNQTREIVR